MHRYLPSVGFDPRLADELGRKVRDEGRVTVQPPYLPAVRLLEVGNDLALLAHESGGPAWPAVSTRWRTDYLLEQLAPMPGGHLTAVGVWEPIPGMELRAAVHVNTYSDQGPTTADPQPCSAYLSLLATSVAARAAADEPRLAPGSGPTANTADQCRLSVRARVTDTYMLPTDRGGMPVRIVWLSAPGAWAIQVAVLPASVSGDCSPGSWVEATGLLQGDLVAAR